MSKLYVNEIASKTGATTAMTIDSSGRVSMPNVIAWRVKRTSGDVGANTDVVFNLVQVSQGGGYSTSTGRFTAPVAGIYFISFTGRANGTSATHMSFKKNGTEFQGFRSTSTGGTVGNVGMSASCVVDLAVNDYIQVRVKDGTMNGNEGLDDGMFSGYFIG